MGEWSVREGTQVNFNGKLLGAGEKFSATDEQVQADGLSRYVEKAPEKKSEPKKAKDDASAKAQPVSANKAQQQPESNKAQASSKDK